MNAFLYVVFEESTKFEFNFKIEKLKILLRELKNSILL